MNPVAPTPSADGMLVLGGLVVAVSTQLGWADAVGLVNVNRSAFQLGDHFSVGFYGPFFLTVGLLMAVIGVARLLHHPGPLVVRRLTQGGGVVLVLDVFREYGTLRHWATHVTTTLSGREIAAVGPGFYLCGAGSLICVAASTMILARVPRRARRGRSALTI